MKKIMIITVVATASVLSASVVTAEHSQRAGQVSEPRASAQAKGEPLPRGPRQVSQAQYEILLGQCRYANTPEAQAQCRAEVVERYRIGAADPWLDCRTYSGATVCGELVLSASEQACVRDAVRGGLSYRRAEVECYVAR